MVTRIWLIGHTWPTPALELLKLSVVNHQIFGFVYSCPGKINNLYHMQLIQVNSATPSLAYALLNKRSAMIMHLNSKVMLNFFKWL